ncbi:hypothetical protein [Bradyrhizobium diazoefficiens]|nr:hypothetical protein [Bradyrhizobium diazoefficiens]
MDIAVMDQPTFLAGIGIAASGKRGRGSMKAPGNPAGKLSMY